MAMKEQPETSNAPAKDDRKWRKAPAELVQWFESEVTRLPGTEIKKMFGYPAGFVNGNMFAALFEDRVVFRLDLQGRERLVQSGCGEPFEPMPGRVMKEYVASTPQCSRDHDLLRNWLEQALTHTSRREPQSSSRKPRTKRVRGQPA